MSEPTRLRDQGPDAVRALLRHAPATRAMTEADRARTRTRVARLAGLAAGVGSLAWLQGAAIGAGLGVLAVGAAEVVPAWLSPAPVSTGARPSVAAPVISGARAAAVAPSAPSAEPAAPPSSASPESPPRRTTARPPETATPTGDDPAPAPKMDSLAEEAALLERARASLGASPAQALALTEAHAAQFPGGKLAMEREMVAIDALRRLGRSADARARGEALLSRARGGLYEERIKKLLDGMR